MTEGQTNSKPLEILVVEDDKAVRSIFSEIISMTGANVTSAEDGADALAHYFARLKEGKPYDAVITDLVMPKIDGAIVTQVVKLVSPYTQVIVITGDEHNSQYRGLSERLVSAKPDGILQKPIEAEDLTFVVDRINFVKEKRDIEPTYMPEPALYKRAA